MSSRVACLWNLYSIVWANMLYVFSRVILWYLLIRKVICNVVVYTEHVTSYENIYLDSSLEDIVVLSYHALEINVLLANVTCPYISWAVHVVHICAKGTMLIEVVIRSTIIVDQESTSIRWYSNVNILSWGTVVVACHWLSIFIV